MPELEFAAYRYRRPMPRSVRQMIIDSGADPDNLPRVSADAERQYQAQLAREQRADADADVAVRAQPLAPRWNGADTAQHDAQREIENLRRFNLERQRRRVFSPEDRRAYEERLQREVEQDTFFRRPPQRTRGW